MTLCTSPFARLARELADSFGVPELPVVIVRDRLVDRTPDEIEAMAAEALPSIIAALTKH